MREEAVARVVTPVADTIESAEEVTLRPRRLSDFVGQPELKEHLGIVLEAARRRGQPARGHPSRLSWRDQRRRAQGRGSVRRVGNRALLPRRK